jgi:uncharacterized protein YdeI (YjbR/CyaY-like superfamily)
MPNDPPDSIHPKTRAEWRAWLEQNHTRPNGVWLVIDKKTGDSVRFEYSEAVEEALCFGWIDSKGNKLDEARWMVWCAPRKPGTGWSAINKERVKRLIAAGQMAPAGLAKIEAARQDGSWNALDEIEALVIPPDLQKALASYNSAQKNFEGFPRSAKLGILQWIASAKTPETRLRRIEETARLAEDNLRANQWRPTKRGLV